MNLRIIGGRLRGKKLYAAAGTLTRPTADRVRESIFNILAGEVSGARVLDLFAGTGSLGIEALSRGAASAVFVDDHPQPLSVIQRNIDACRLDAVARIVRRDLRREAGWQVFPGSGFQLVFMDPPYNQVLVTPTLVQLHANHLLEKDALVVAEHTPLESPGEEIRPLLLCDRRKYGKTLVSFFRYTV